MGNDRRRFSRLAPCQDGCRLANAGCLVLSNPVSLTATVCIQYSSVGVGRNNQRALRRGGAAAEMAQCAPLIAPYGAIYDQA